MDCIDQSVEIDDALVSFINSSWFSPISSIYIRRYICSSKTENRIHANSKFIGNWVATESRRKNTLQNSVGVVPGVVTSQISQTSL